MAYITPIGANPEQVDYRLGQGHGCGGPQGTDREFSYHTDGRERPLRWIGRGLHEVGIEPGSVLDEDQFPAARALMDGRDPRTGETLVEAKRAVPDDAKVGLAPLVRAVEEVAAEADVSTDEVLGHHGKTIERFERARRSVERRGEAARLRADHAGAIADAAGLDVEAVWGEQVYATAVGNLFETVTVTDADGTVREQRRPRRVIVGNAGYDVTFTLPKSLSVLLAFADADTAAAVEGIYTDGVARTFAWLEEATAYGMRGWHGSGNTAETVKGSGFLGWTMVHRAARPVAGAEAGDPHWHVHTTIANMTRGADGKWSTVAAGGRDLMRHAPAVDHLLKALVRRELSTRLGVEFARNDRTGAWEIVGIPDATLQQFSKRHSDIEQMLTALGYDADTVTRAQERIAEQQSRGAKGEATAAADATLQQLWRTEETTAGRDPDAQMRAVFGDDGPDATDIAPTPDPHGPSDGPHGAAGEVTVAQIAAQLLDPDTGVTAHSRRFSRADALARVADALPHGCASAEELERLTDEVLAAAGFRALSDVATTVQGPYGPNPQLAASHMANAATYTTTDVVDAETRILRTAKAAHDEQLATRVDDDVLELGAGIVESQQGYPLSDEQRAALHRLVTSGRAVDTVQGAPGTGKTTLMRALRVVYEAAGYVVAGAATAAVAGQNLQTESGIAARTVASYLNRLREGGAPLRGVDVLVVDEANLTEDRDRAALYQHAAETGTKLIEIGDAKQLRGVGVGSLFGRVHEIVDGPALVNNRRQADEDERAALAAWREGRYAEALSIWHGRGQFHATDTAEQATAAMLSTWREQRQGAPDAHTEMRGLVMLAATNEQVRRLNAAAQAARAADGELGDSHTYEVAGSGRMRLHTGDHILLRINDYAGRHVSGPPVLNGYRAVITDIDAHGRITAEWQADTADGPVTRTAELSPSYVGHGGVELGYAMTVHKAEGLTVRASWQRPDGETHRGSVLFHAVGADNPSAYVALSRHRGMVALFGGLAELETAQERYLQGPPRTSQETADRAIGQLAEHARATAEHGDDRPVVVDLGLSEFAAEADQDVRTGRQSADTDRQTAEQRDAERAARQRAAAERAQERDERAQVRQQRRETAERLLRQTWRHEPNLVERILIAAAFDTLASNLADAVEAGYDPHEVLAEIDLRALTSERVRDPARYAAWGVDRAVHRLRTGEAQRDHEWRAAAAEFAVMRDQVADLLDQQWPDRPELVAAITNSGAFDAFVRNVDHYTAAGLDTRDLLGALSPQTLSQPTVRDAGAYATYALRRVGETQLAEQAEREHRQDRAEAAAQLLRHAWSHTPDAAERVITGAAFGHLADRMDRAATAGHDVPGLLAGLDPHVLTASHVPSSSGTTAFVFDRAVSSLDNAAPVTPPLSTDTSAALVRAAREATTTGAPTTSQAEPDADRAAAITRAAEVNAAAAAFYRTQLAEHPAAGEYLRARVGDVDALAERFTLGYAPPGWQHLTEHLQQLGYSEHDLVESGLAKHTRDGRLIDRFRDRVLVGLHDTDGRLTGFTGRPPHEPDADTPKYLNTPATAAFDKSSMLLGLHEGREQLAAGATPVLVEGPLDVLALATASPAGEQEIVPVSAAGTAVTEQHLAAIAATTGRDDLVLALDGDQAGHAAAERTAAAALSVLPGTRVMTLPDGHDPASWAAAHLDEPHQVTAPYTDQAAQQPAGVFVAEQVVERYFAAHPEQHRDEVEGKLGAARAAVDAISAADADTAAATGLHLATRLRLDPVTVAGMFGEHQDPTPGDDAAAAPDQPERDEQPQPTQPDLDSDQHSEPGADEAPSAARQVPHFTAREHGQLTDTDIDAAIEEASSAAEQAALDTDQAETEASSLRAEVDAEQGPQVRAVDDNLAQLRHQAALVREHGEIETSWREATDRAAAAAEQRARAEAERDTLSRLARSRRAALTEQIEQARETETTAHAEAGALAERAGALVEQTGNAEQRRQLLVRANAAEDDYDHARAAAQRRDVEAAEAAERRAARLAEQQTECEQRAESLTGEQQFRAELPEPVRAAEQTERAHLLHPAQLGNAGVDRGKQGLDEIELDQPPDPALQLDEQVIEHSEPGDEL